MIVRGEATGTPMAEFWRAAPTGRSFRTMAIDLFTVRDGKLATVYHIENWSTALEQLRA
ncbi:SnoaL-like polyketide cyclase [Kribbella orskensis]|uniref:SnoaL-like polyketide cyclase n=2 Tax=Kribbellaceae TaxID=2726069 RepID=A0ABY2BDG3_9ACTN|nr:SnoaL-like polyketide cyclase [Kribbella sp. VKM Ac-2500]TCO17018.1 SnoaL-like polyketide cyclase [Kribbella orskensis]